MKMANMDDYFDVVIVGTGAAGLYCALNLPARYRILLLTKQKADESDSFLAQGGICMQHGEADYRSFFDDTMRAGHYENNPATVDLMIRSSNSIIRDLVRRGVRFARDDHGALRFTREGAHSRPRILFHEDITGHEITQTLLNEVLRCENIELREHTTLLDFFADASACGGVIAAGPDGEPRAIGAGAVSYANGKLDDEVSAVKEGRIHAVPKHHANIYYNGDVGKLGIDFNMDYMWRKKHENSDQSETNMNQQKNLVASTSIGHSRMFAEKLVLSYPLWKGQIEVGNEYTASQVLNDFNINMATIGNSNTKSDEKNMAGFFSIGQQFGKIAVEAGLRYEHVRFKYTEDGQLKEDKSKTYNNVFPSLAISTEIGKTQWALSYNSKMQRPSYDDLDGTLNYVNRLTLQSGNPYLSPVKIHSVELMGAWKQFFAKVSYEYKKNAIINESKPYGEDGEMKLLTMENTPKIQELQAFLGAQFQIGFWQPKVNAGIIKQWFSGEYLGERKSFYNPLAVVQFQNAIHLPGDIWMNIDIEWNSRGNKENMKLSSSSYLNAKLYKAFCRNRFSVTLEGNDIFNKSNRDVQFYNKDVTLWQSITNDSRSLLLTLQYNFNASRSRYKGQGAGKEELNRF